MGLVIQLDDYRPKEGERWDRLVDGGNILDDINAFHDALCDSTEQTPARIEFGKIIDPSMRGLDDTPVDRGFAGALRKWITEEIITPEGFKMSVQTTKMKNDKPFVNSAGFRNFKIVAQGHIVDDKGADSE